MNAVRIRDEDLGWANMLSDERRELAFDLWVACDEDGTCFIVWDGSYDDLYQVLKRGYPQAGAVRIMGTLSGKALDERREGLHVA